ncbi:MAG: hypothetical protein AABZ06_08845 [Bdellovibrionota bacterium]
MYSASIKQSFWVLSGFLISVCHNCFAIDNKPDSGVLLYKANGNEVSLYDANLEYSFSTGHFPCGRAEADVLKLSPKDRSLYISNKCNLKLYSFGVQGVEEVKIVKTSVKQIEGACGDKAPEMVATIKPLRNTFFVTSIAPKNLKEARFIPVNQTIREKFEPKLKNLKMPFPIKNKKIKRILEDPMSRGNYFVEVVGVFDAKGDIDKGQKNGPTTWTGIFYVTPKNTSLISPEDMFEEVYYGKNRNIIGFYDLGYRIPIIVIGYKSEPGMIIRYEDGAWRNYFFAFYPAGGC